MAGGASGLAIGRALFQDPEPKVAAALVAEIVHGSTRRRRRPATQGPATGGAVPA